MLFECAIPKGLGPIACATGHDQVGPPLDFVKSYEPEVLEALYATERHRYAKKKKKPPLKPKPWEQKRMLHDGIVPTKMPLRNPSPPYSTFVSAA